MARGTFVHANPSDPIHYGKGRVTVYDGLLHLEPDFEVGPGPKFHVYLVPEKEVVPSTNVARTMFVDLGRLKAFKGSQNYEIPAGVEPLKYGSVVIWCEQFGVLISPAMLAPTTSLCRARICASSSRFLSIILRCSLTIRSTSRLNSSALGSLSPRQYSRNSACEQRISSITDCASPTSDTAMAIRREEQFGSWEAMRSTGARLCTQGQGKKNGARL